MQEFSRNTQNQKSKLHCIKSKSPYSRENLFTNAMINYGFFFDVDKKMRVAFEYAIRWN